jgi:aryl-alcohol dehydrogenase-like predicted oxidoreductase
VPIPGTRKLTRLGENLGAIAIKLTPDELDEIDAGLGVRGARRQGDGRRAIGLMSPT